MISYILRGTDSNLHRTCILLALSLTLFSSGAYSQEQLATILGTVTDQSGAVIPEVQVTILNQGTALRRSALTDLSGQYRIAGLPTGNYSVRVEKEGFQTQIREGIALASASDIMVNLSLSLGDLRQEVTVGADFSTIDSTTSTVSAAIPGQTLAELPIIRFFAFRR